MRVEINIGVGFILSDLINKCNDSNIHFEKNVEIEKDNIQLVIEIIDQLIKDNNSILEASSISDQNMTIDIFELEDIQVIKEGNKIKVTTKQLSNALLEYIIKGENSEN